LVDWILRDVDLDEYAKKLDRKVKFELEASNWDRKEDEREAEEEETSTDEELAESSIISSKQILSMPATREINLLRSLYGRNSLNQRESFSFFLKNGDNYYMLHLFYKELL